MANQSSKPKFIYKLVPSSAPVPTSLPERLPVSDLDRSDGFIHLSTAVQLPDTLKRFFKEESIVYVLRIAYDALDEQNLIKWEDSNGKTGLPGGDTGERVFPHLYNGLKLGSEEIESVKTLEQDAKGWDKAIEKAQEDWLVY